MTLYLEFRLLSPTCIAQRPTSPGQPTETVGYLTGTVIRGGLASLYLAGRSPDDLTPDEYREFIDLFAREQVLFDNALPIDGGITHVVPRTAWSPKRDSGWLGGKRPGKGVRDALAALIASETDAAATHGIEREEWDGWDRFDGEFVKTDRKQEDWSSIPVRRRLLSRTALNTQQFDATTDSRGTTVEGQLYSFEALETGQRFIGSISGPDQDLQRLRTIVERSGSMSVGQGRSRGMGRVSVRMLDGYRPPTVVTQKELLQAAADFTQRAGGKPNVELYLPVTLLSDTLLRDNYLLPCTSGDPCVTLGRYASLEPPLDQTMKLLYAVQSARWIGGWDALRGLPRPPQLAVQQGSVWVYRAPIEHADAAISWWQAREADGIGERRSEGFGRVRLLHTLHMEDEIR